MRYRKVILGTLLSFGLLMGGSCSTLMTPSSLVGEAPDAVVKAGEGDNKISKSKSKKKKVAKKRNKMRKDRNYASASYSR